MQYLYDEKGRRYLDAFGGIDILVNNAATNPYAGPTIDVDTARWNKTIEKVGCDFRLKLPSSRFRRIVGSWAGHHTDPDGKVVKGELRDRFLVERGNG